MNWAKQEKIIKSNTMKTRVTLLLATIIVNFAFAQNSGISDVNFEKALIDLGFDNGNPDGLVPTASIDTITNLNVSGKSIIDLNGIQDFKALTNLNISNNDIVEIKITSNTALAVLDCSNNNIANLNLSLNTALVELFCNNNVLTSLDLSKNVANLGIVIANDNKLTSFNMKNGTNLHVYRFDARNNPDLTCIEVNSPDYSSAIWTSIDPQTTFSENCSATVELAYIPDYNFEKTLIDRGYDTGAPDNYIPVAAIDTVLSLDISNRNIADLTGIEYFTALEVLDCSDNGLTTLNFTKNYTLLSLTCDNNILSELNISQNNLLKNLYCQNNELANLSLTNNIALNVLVCSDNLLTALDLTQNSSLFRLFSRNNNLTSLNVKNGNNTFINRFDVVNNPNLTCIDVDDKAYSIANWKSIDPQAGFSETCGSLGVDEYLEQNITVYPNPTTTRVIINFDNQIDIKAIKTFDVYGRLLDTSIHNNIDLSTYSSGLYFMKMKTNKGNLTKKVIKL